MEVLLRLYEEEKMDCLQVTKLLLFLAWLMACTDLVLGLYGITRLNSVQHFHSVWLPIRT
jgi:hypothetical protein